MKRLLFALLVLMPACPGCPPAGPASTDVGVVQPHTWTCDDVCKNLQVLGCPAGQPTPNGVPCTAVCQNVQTSGILKWDLSCRAQAASCDAVDRCQ